MALTIAQVATPNSGQTFLTLGQFDAIIVDVTFDSSYLTTGEVITAAQLGMTSLVGAIPLTPLTNAAGTLGLPLIIRPNTAQTQLACQALRYDGAAAGKASLEEAASGFDASLFSCRLMIFGS